MKAKMTSTDAQNRINKFAGELTKPKQHRPPMTRFNLKDTLTSDDTQRHALQALASLVLERERQVRKMVADKLDGYRPSSEKEKESAHAFSVLVLGRKNEQRNK